MNECEILFADRLQRPQSARMVALSLLYAAPHDAAKPASSLLCAYAFESYPLKFLTEPLGLAHRPGVRRFGRLPTLAYLGHQAQRGLWSAWSWQRPRYL